MRGSLLVCHSHAGLGLGSAWVQNQRYVLFDVIQKGPGTTAELAEMGGLA
jgi:hypothetical protein